MIENYTLPQELTFAEYLQSTIYISLRMKIVKRIFFFAVAIGILGGLLNTFLIEKPAEHWYQPTIQFILAPLFMICFFTIFITIISAIVYNRMRKHFKGITFHFNHWGIEKRGDGVDFSTPWRKALKLKENNKFLFLYIGENTAYIFQKRMFSHVTELEEFKDFLASKLN